MSASSRSKSNARPPASTFECHKRPDTSQVPGAFSGRLNADRRESPRKPDTFKSLLGESSGVLNINNKKVDRRYANLISLSDGRESTMSMATEVSTASSARLPKLPFSHDQPPTSSKTGKSRSKGNVRERNPPSEESKPKNQQDSVTPDPQRTPGETTIILLSEAGGPSKTPESTPTGSTLPAVARLDQPLRPVEPREEGVLMKQLASRAVGISASISAMNNHWGSNFKPHTVEEYFQPTLTDALEYHPMEESMVEPLVASFLRSQIGMAKSTRSLGSPSFKVSDTGPSKPIHQRLFDQRKQPPTGPQFRPLVSEFGGNRGDMRRGIAARLSELREDEGKQKQFQKECSDWAKEKSERVYERFGKRQLDGTMTKVISTSGTQDGEEQVIAPVPPRAKNYDTRLQSVKERRTMNLTQTVMNPSHTLVIPPQHVTGRSDSLVIRRWLVLVTLPKLVEVMVGTVVRNRFSYHQRITKAPLGLIMEISCAFESQKEKIEALAIVESASLVWALNRRIRRRRAAVASIHRFLTMRHYVASIKTNIKLYRANIVECQRIVRSFLLRRQIKISRWLMYWRATEESFVAQCSYDPAIMELQTKPTPDATIVSLYLSPLHRKLVHLYIVSFREYLVRLKAHVHSVRTKLISVGAVEGSDTGSGESSTTPASPGKSTLDTPSPARREQPPPTAPSLYLNFIAQRDLVSFVRKEMDRRVREAAPKEKEKTESSASVVGSSDEGDQSIRLAGPEHASPSRHRTGTVVKMLPEGGPVSMETSVSQTAGSNFPVPSGPRPSTPPNLQLGPSTLT